MLREIFAIIGCALAVLLACASLASASPVDGPAKRSGACARSTDGACMPNLGALRLSVEGRPGYVRMLSAGACVRMPVRFTDLHAYGPRGRALVQRADATGYVFSAPASGRTLAHWNRETRTWCGYGDAIAVGWQA